MANKLFIDYFFFFKLAFICFSLIFSGLRVFGRISDGFLLKASKIVFLVSISFIFSRIIFLFWFQFVAWQGSYFLPPYQPIGYFLQYSWTHFAKQPIFDISLGVFFFLLIWLGEKISRGRFFYDEEKYSGGLAILLNHWPVNILVFFLVFLTGILFSLARRVFKGRGRGGAVLTNFRYLWPVIGLGLLLFGDILVNFLGLGILAV